MAKLRIFIFTLIIFAFFVTYVYAKEEIKLSNGLCVVLEEDHTLPLISLYIIYKTPDYSYNPIVTVPELMKDLLFKETQKLQEGEIEEKLYSYGAKYNAYTTKDYIAFYETFPSNYIDEVLRIEIERMNRAKFSDSALEWEKKIVFQNMEELLNNPEFIANAALTNIIINDEEIDLNKCIEEVKNLKLQELKKFYKKYFTPENATLVVVGDFKKNDILKYIKKTLGKIPSLKKEKLPLDVDLQATPEIRNVEIQGTGNKQYVQIAYKIATPDDNDFIKFLVLDKIITERLKKFPYKTESWVDTSKKLPFYYFTIALEENGGEDLKKVLSKFDLFLNGFILNPPTKDETDQALALCKFQWLYLKDSLENRAQYLGINYNYSSIENWENFPEILKEITPQDITLIINNYLKPENRFICFYSNGGLNEVVNSSLYKTEAKPTDTSGFRFFNDEKPDNMYGKREECLRKITDGVMRKRLSNGMLVSVLEKQNTPVVAFQGIIKAGQICEPTGNAGLNYVFADLLNSSIPAMPSNIKLKFKANPDNISFTMFCAPGDIRASVEILFKTITNSEFDLNTLEKCKQRANKTSNAMADLPQKDIEIIFNNQLYPPEHPYHYPIAGVSETVNKIILLDVLWFQKAYIIPANIIVSVVGNCNYDEVCDIFGEYFSKWAPNSEVLIPNVYPIANSTTSKEIVVNLDNAISSYMIIGNCGLNYESGDWYGAFIANFILGGDPVKGRLSKRLRDKEKLVTHIESTLYQYRDAPWTITMSSFNPSDKDKILEAVKDEIKKLKTEGPTEEELKSAKQFLANRLIVSLDGSENIASLLSNIDFRMLGENYLKRFSGLYNSVSKEQVKNAMEKYFNPNTWIIVTAQPKNEIK